MTSQNPTIITPPADGNLLRHETSPYLLQHADNPVHWRGWGAAALAQARATNRPILLSIGYAACHWCHVMAHESFEDAETAALMNSLFVPIKVDREERPDIDHIYMSALHALGEQGGWPLTMFLTPDGDPFWGGTYFPPEPRWGRPSFRQVLQGVADAYHEKADSIGRNVAALRGALSAAAAAPSGPMPTPANLNTAAASLLRMTDRVQGGMRGAPKFPNPAIFRFLWQNACRTGALAGRDAVHLLLRRMSQGGIYDHLGGGYARYATDAAWLVPHFEKMLYDNAQILELLALAFADVPDPLYAARADETVDWMLRDMPTGPGGHAFAASEDADSEGEEGRFYVWTETAIDAVLGAASPAFKAAYDVTTAGNWEGHTILQRITPPGTGAEEAALAESRAQLLAARAARVRPGRDDKVLTDWNALAIAALCRAGTVFGRPAWIGAAAAAFDTVAGLMVTGDGRMQHAWRLGRVTAAGMLDDQANMARAALALFEATGDPSRLAQAEDLARVAGEWFGGDGGYFVTARDADDIPMGAESRPRTIADNATPAGAGLMAEILARLYLLSGAPEWRRQAEAALSAFAGLGDRLSAAPTLLTAADLLEGGATVVVAGLPDANATQTLLATALGAADPAICVLRVTDPASVPRDHPAHGKIAADGVPAAYVCRNGVCAAPVSDAAVLARLLSPGRPPA